MGTNGRLQLELLDWEARGQADGRLVTLAVRLNREAWAETRQWVLDVADEGLVTQPRSNRALSNQGGDWVLCRSADGQ